MIDARRVASEYLGNRPWARHSRRARL